MKGTSLRRVVVILAVGAAACLALFLAFHLRRVKETLPTPPSRTARHNRYLAAMRILRGSGFSVHEAKDLERGVLPPLHSTLLIAVPRTYLSKRHSARLLDWVQRGGHLVVVPTLATDGPAGVGHEVASRQAGPALRDPVFDAVGIDVDVPDPDELDPQPPWGGRGAGDPAPDLGHFNTDDGTDYAIGPNSDIGLTGDTRADWTLGNDTSTFAASLDHGAGRLTLLANGRFLKNRYIGAGDNAALLLQAVGQASADRPVWWVVSLAPPSLSQLVHEYAGLAVVAALVLLLAWVWRHAARFGPTAPRPAPVRRSLLEHVAASGLFLWRHAGRTGLLRAAQDTVRQRARRRTPGWSRLSPDERNQRIAVLCRVEPAEVAAALGAVEVANPMQMVALIQQTERLRTQL